MPSTNDWAAKAAERILSEMSIVECQGYSGTSPEYFSVSDYEVVMRGRNANDSIHRIAAIIATHSEPLVALLREARKEHDSRCPCGSVDDTNLTCICDAEEWNAKIDEILNAKS